MNGWLRELIEGYRWLWIAQVRWSRGPRWLAWPRFVGRVVADIARAAIPARLGGTMMHHNPPLMFGPRLLVKSAGMAVVVLTISLVIRDASPLQEPPMIVNPAEAVATDMAAALLELRPSYPNPFITETTIPFVLHEELFDGARPAVVSIQVFNLLQQLVASPVAIDHDAGRSARVAGLVYTQPGAYEAVWDGDDMAGSEAPSGMYLVRLSVGGQRATRLIVRERTGTPVVGAE
jgi:hypothetical protein